MSKFCLFLLLCSLAACQLPVVQHIPQSETPSPQLQLELAGQNMDAEQLNDFLIQSIERKQGKKLSKQAKKSAKEIWEHLRNQHGNAQRTPELRIDDVLLSETGQSIIGANAPAGIEPDFAGKEIRLTINGVFKDKKKALQQSSFLFTLDPELLAQSFLWSSDRQPRSRVLLDQSLLLQTEAVSGTQIQVRLSTERDLTYLLKGLHHLSVEHGNYYTDTLVRVTEPTPTQEDLAPQIEDVQVLTNQQGQPSLVWVQCFRMNA